MSHIANGTRELQDIGDRAVIDTYEQQRTAQIKVVDAAQAELEATEDDEDEAWAAQRLREALVELAQLTARYRRAVQRQARREREAKEKKKR